MKKLIVFAVLFCAACTGFAQTNTITGTVKDDERQPIHFAFIKDMQSKAATYTDSLGNFNISALPNSLLYINSIGYRDTIIKVNNRSSIDIALKGAVVISATKTKKETNLHADAVYQQLTSIERDNLAGPGLGSGRQQSFDAAPGAILPQFHPKDETVGSRYFLKGWMHGYVTTSKDSIIQNPLFLFTYDKMGGALLMTQNEESAYEVNKSIVRSFTLYDNTNTAYTFANVPVIDTQHYMQVLASGNKYNIYKQISTKFEKQNYTTDGVMSRGHNYDEYNDEYTYYVYDVKANTFQLIQLKKKSLKAAFPKDADKLNKYLSDNSGTIDEFYLTNLGEFLNE